MFKELDPILHSQLRLAVMSLLISVKQAEFIFIKEKINENDLIDIYDYYKNNIQLQKELNASLR